MRVIGIVRWKTNDKAGHPIAGVEPLYEIDGDDWRSVSAAEEFPSQGQVFWPFAGDAVEQTIVFFQAEENRGHKDLYRVADAHPAVEVVDLRELGDPGAIKAALTLGIRRRGFREGVVLIRSESDVLIGPVKLVRRADGLLTFEATHPDRIPCFRGFDGEDLRSIEDGDQLRTILARPLGAKSIGAPTGFVDWDDDRLIVRRALTVAVERAKQAGDDPGLTKRMIKRAAKAVAGKKGGPELELEQYRLSRALELCSKATFVSGLASELTTELMDHPSVVSSLDEQSRKTRDRFETALRAEIEESLKTSREELVRLERQTTEARLKLDDVKRETAESRELAESQAAELDAEISSRVAELLERPTVALADVAILRSFFGLEGLARSASPVAADSRRHLDWAPAVTKITEKVDLQRELLGSFKTLGITPLQALRLHGAVAAGLLPVLTGAGALAALLAYARIVCGGRVAVVHVAPDMLRPVDLDGKEVREAAAASRRVSAPSLVVFEGANRSPVEAYLTPFLQALESVPPESDLSSVAFFGGSGGVRPPGLRWAATAVGGAATVPLSRDLWAHAVSIHVGSANRTPVSTAPPTEVELSSELLVPAEPPEGVVEEIVETWPLAIEVEGSLRSFARGLSRFESDPNRLKRALVEGCLLPLVASLQNQDLRSQSLEQLDSLVREPGVEKAPLIELERRLRWRLA